MIVSLVVIGAGIVTMTTPEFQPLSILVVGVVIGLALLAPYVPAVDISHLPTSLAGILVASVGYMGS